MKRRGLSIFLVIAILWVASLAVMAAVVTPDTPLEEYSQSKDFNTTRTNTVGLSIGTDDEGGLVIGMVQIVADGKYQMGAYGQDSRTFEFDDNGNVLVSEPSRNLAFDDDILKAIENAVEVWAESLKGRGVPIQADIETVRE